MDGNTEYMRLLKRDQLLKQDRDEKYEDMHNLEALSKALKDIIANGRYREDMLAQQTLEALQGWTWDKIDIVADETWSLDTEIAKMLREMKRAMEEGTQNPRNL